MYSEVVVAQGRTVEKLDLKNIFHEHGKALGGVMGILWKGSEYYQQHKSQSEDCLFGGH